MTPTSDLTTWIRISDPGSEILGSGSHGSIEKLRLRCVTLLRSQDSRTLSKAIGANLDCVFVMDTLFTLIELS